MKIILTIIVFILCINANDINFRQQAIQKDNVINQEEESVNDYGILLGLGWGLAEIFTKHTIEQGANKTVSISKNKSHAINAFIGLYSDSGHFGGRVYAGGSIFKTPLFSVLDGGLNLDLFINFLDSNIFNIGTILGIGGGMYIVKLNDTLSSEGKVPLSPIGWVNAGFRIKLLGSSLEVIYKMPYIYASVYNNAISTQSQNIFETKADMYFIKANSINVNYVYYF